MYKELVERQRALFNSGLTKGYHFRLLALNKLEKMILLNEDLIEKALFIDLGKSRHESYLTEIGLVLKEISFFKRKLASLMKPIKKKSPLPIWPAKSYLYPEPLGNILIIAPWNYPFLLAILPLVGAIAAGNTCIIKPSEVSDNTSKLLLKLIEETFDSAFIAVTLGGAYETGELLNYHFDYIFFTGSQSVGKIVMEKAAKNLTPLTLELGGKSPAVITRNYDVKLAARRIAFGKVINAGQTCIAPDFLMIHESQVDQFIIYYGSMITEFFGKNVLDNDNYPKIINQKHHQRLVNYLNDGHLVYGGHYSATKIEPTLLLVRNLATPIMTDEIFGPILPVITFKNEAELFKTILSLPKPLASYVFSDDEDFKLKWIDQVSAGAVVFNDTIIQFMNNNLGFGGVGSSGFGKYQGVYSFNSFSHYKPVIDRSVKFDLKIRYQPLDDKKLKWIKKILK